MTDRTWNGGGGVEEEEDEEGVGSAMASDGGLEEEEEVRPYRVGRRLVARLGFAPRDSLPTRKCKLGARHPARPQRLLLLSHPQPVLSLRLSLSALSHPRNGHEHHLPPWRSV